MAAAGASAPNVAAEADSAIVLQPFDPTAGGLTVVSSDSGSSGDSVEVDLLPAKPALPRQIAIHVPRGYTLDLTAKPGDEVGDAAILLSAVDAPAFATGYGSLIAKDPAQAGSSGCVAPGAHAAVWSLSTSLGLQQVTLNIYVDRASEDDAYVLTLCPSQLTSDTKAGASITLSPYGLVGPKEPGDYRWRAVVTPEGSPMYELQALVPLPESVTVRARYDAKHKRAVITGKVVEGGKPVARAQVVVFGRRKNRTLDFFETRTSAGGAFTKSVRVAGTTDFAASVGSSLGPCQPIAGATIDCLGSTIVAPDTGWTTLWVSVPTGAVRAIRPADQRRAERAALTQSDFPGEFDTTFAGADECLNPKHESELTITGEASSPAFFHYVLGDSPSLTQAWTLTRVYATRRQAQAGLAHQARSSVVRCVLEESGLGSSRAFSLHLPRLPAAVRAFRATDTEDGLTLTYDLIFLQRGRTVTILQAALVNSSDQLESELAAVLAARMR